MNLYHSFAEFKFPSDNMWNDEVLKLLKNPSDAVAREFIVKYFSFRDKKRAFDYFELNDKDFCKKNVHVFSSFMLGLLLKGIVETNLNIQVQTGPGYEFGFEYIWFLSCLYHDATADLERKIKQIESKPLTYMLVGNIKIMKLLNKNNFNLTYNLYHDMLDDVDVKELLHTYTEDVVENYFKMRVQSNSLDHGIVAGYVLFDRLLKNYEESWKNETSQKSDKRKACFETYNKNDNRHLSWRQEQLWVFGYVADAIVAHNIWHVDATKESNKEAANKYKDFSLESLVHYDSSNNGKISLENNPLSFYLGLIDSIEPVKYFSCIKPKYIWEHISIELENNKTITISQDVEAFNFDKWYNDKMKTMPDWLSGIQITLPKDNNNIRIEIS